MVQDVQTLMDEYEDTFEMSLQGKIHCKLTGHDFPYKLEEFKKYIATPKFIRAYELQKFEKKYADHFEDIGNNLYGCKLTLRTVAKDAYSLNHHVNGMKFKNALKKHQEKLEKGDAPSDNEKDDEEMPVEQEEEEEVDVKPKATKAGKRKTKAKQTADEEMPIGDEEVKPANTRKTRSTKKVEEGEVVEPKAAKSAGKRKAVVKQPVDEEMPVEDEEEDQPKADKRKKSSGTKRNSVKKARRS